MRFVPDENAAAWLRDFIPEPDAFDWDAGNRTKNAKHGVREEEVESIFHQEKFLFAGLRPISCRPMRPDERRLYEASIQEHS